MSLVQQIDYVSPAISANTHICDDYHQIAGRMINLNHGVFSVIDQLGVLKSVCRGFSYRSRVHASCIKIELANIEFGLAEWIYNKVKSLFFQFRLDLSTGNLYFNENSIKQEEE